VAEGLVNRVALFRPRAGLLTSAVAAPYGYEEDPLRDTTKGPSPDGLGLP